MTRTSLLRLGLIFLVLLSGCSRLELALRWADTFVMSSVTDYFELTSEQKSQARGEFKKALAEIQKNDFPGMAKTLRDLADATEKNQINDETLENFLKGVLNAFRTSAVRFEPMAQKIVADQVASNFKLFDKEFQKKYDKDLEKSKDPKKHRGQVEDRIERFVDETIGYLSDSQEKQLKEWLDQTPSPDALQLESRKIVFEKFKTARTEEKSRIEFVHTFFSNWESLQTPAYLAARSEYQKKSKSIMLQILLASDDKQRKNMSKNLRGRADELQKLSEKDL